jgi:predicted transcriptional regulator
MDRKDLDELVYDCIKDGQGFTVQSIHEITNIDYELIVEILSDFVKKKKIKITENPSVYWWIGIV